MSMNLTERLVNLIEKKKNYVIARSYKKRNQIRYLEIFNINTSQTFLLDLGRKYDFKNIPRLKNKHQYDLVRVSGKDLAKDKSLDDVMYDRIGDSEAVDEEHILNGYRTSIRIDDDGLTKDVLRKTLLSLIEQVCRIGTTVHQIEYKLALYDARHMCILDSENKTHLYHLRDYPSKKRLMFVVVKLREFYKTRNVGDNVTHVQKSIYGILEQNQRSYKSKVIDSVGHLKSIEGSIDQLTHKKVKCLAAMSEINTLLQDLSAMETQTHENKGKLKPKTLRKKLESIQQTRGDLLSKNKKLKTEYDEIIFVLDEVYCSSLESLSKLARGGKVLHELTN